MRDWLYVIDHCKAVDMILHNGTEGEIYNIAGGNEITNIDMMDRICSHLGKSANKVHIANRPCHDTKYTLDYSKIERELGYTNSSNFEDNLKYTIDWYMSHPTWFNKK